MLWRISVQSGSINLLRRSGVSEGTISLARDLCRGPGVYARMIRKALGMLPKSHGRNQCAGIGFYLCYSAARLEHLIKNGEGDSERLRADLRLTKEVALKQLELLPHAEPLVIYEALTMPARIGNEIDLCHVTERLAQKYVDWMGAQRSQ